MSANMNEEFYVVVSKNDPEYKGCDLYLGNRDVMVGSIDDAMMFAWRDVADSAAGHVENRAGHLPAAVMKVQQVSSWKRVGY